MFRRTMLIILAGLITLPTQLFSEIPASAAQPADQGGAIVPYHPPTGQYVDPRPFTASVPSKPVPRMVTAAPDPKAPKGYVEGKSQEMPLARTANRNVYANPDGTYTAKMYSAPVNWLASPNNWLAIDNGIAASADGTFHNTSGPVSMHFAKSSGAGSLVQLSSGASNVGFSAPTGAADVRPVINGNTIRYPAAFPGVDLEYHVEGGKLKEFLVLHNAPAAGSAVEFQFPLQFNSLRAVTETGGGIGLYQGTTAIFEIPAGQMSDSKQDPGRGDSASAPVAYSLLQTPAGTSLVVKADEAWLSSPSRKYPGRLTQLQNHKVGPPETVMADYSAGYDPAGRITSQTGPDGQTLYSYDTIGHLEIWTAPSTARTRYYFDSNSNRTQQTLNGSATHTYTYASDATDRLLTVDGGTYGYDPAGTGDTTSRPGQTLAWDAFGQLQSTTTSSGNAAYTRDVLGRVRERVQKDGSGNITADTVYRFDGSNDAPAYETNAAGTAITRSYLSGADGLTVTYSGNRSSTASFDYADIHGNVVLYTDAAGSVTGGPFTYDPFGIPTNSPAASPYGFVGKWQKLTDPLSGLIIMGARPYDASLGRFLSVDPVAGGSANDYDYVNQDPVNGFDLDGRCIPMCVVLVIGGALLIYTGFRIVSAWQVYQAGHERSYPDYGPTRRGYPNTFNPAARVNQPSGATAKPPAYGRGPKGLKKRIFIALFIATLSTLLWRITHPDSGGPQSMSGRGRGMQYL